MKRYVKTKNVLKRSVKYRNLKTGNICVSQDEYDKFRDGEIEEIHVLDNWMKLITKLTPSQITGVETRKNYILLGYK